MGVYLIGLCRYWRLSLLLLMALPACGQSHEARGTREAALLKEWQALATHARDELDNPRASVIAAELALLRPEGVEPILRVLEDPGAEPEMRVFAATSIEGLAVLDDARLPAGKILGELLIIVTRDLVLGEGVVEAAGVEAFLSQLQVDVGLGLDLAGIGEGGRGWLRGRHGERAGEGQHEGGDRLPEGNVDFFHDCSLPWDSGGGLLKPGHARWRQP